MSIGPTLFHPCKNEQQAITIFLFIGQLPIPQLVRQIKRTTFQHRLVIDNTIGHMHIFGRRAHLHRDRSAIIGKPTVRNKEPVIRLSNRTFIIQREHHEITLDGILATDSLNGIAPTLQPGQVNLLVRIRLLPFALVDAITQLCIDVHTCSIKQVEGHLATLFCQHLFWDINTKGRFAIAQWQRQLTMVGLTSLVCDVY